MSSVIPWFEVPTLAVAGVAIDVSSLLAVAGALLALAMARQGARRAGLMPRRAVDLLGLTLLSGLFFGRLSEVVYYPDQLAADWGILLPWRGGFASIGVFVGGALTAILLFRRLPAEARALYADVLAPAAILGGALVRVGCFLGHHHAGRLSSLPLAVAYPGGARFDLGLLEALWLLAIFVGVVRWRTQPGRIAAVSVTAYAVGRFAIELLRGHDLELIGRRSDARYLGLTLVQYVTVAIAMAGAAWLARRRV